MVQIFFASALYITFPFCKSLKNWTGPFLFPVWVLVDLAGYIHVTLTCYHRLMFVLKFAATNDVHFPFALCLVLKGMCAEYCCLSGPKDGVKALC